jgi:hypothetical protein
MHIVDGISVRLLENDRSCTRRHDWRTIEEDEAKNRVKKRSLQKAQFAKESEEKNEKMKNEEEEEESRRILKENQARMKEREKLAKQATMAEARKGS